MRTFRNQARGNHAAQVFLVAFAVLFVAHAPLLGLPYFWDEAGYYIPAARDLLLTGSLIPHSTPSNAHPPLVMAYLALWWKIAGFAPVVTRTAMLLVSAFALTGVFLLAKLVTNRQVAVASAICAAAYPVFFAQSSLAHVDLASAGLTLWGLHAYVQDRRLAAAFWFSLAALTKETAILAPIALLTWEGIARIPRLRSMPVVDDDGEFFPRGRNAGFRRSALLLLPCVPLAFWYSYHDFRTGFVFGNPEFFRYNVEATLHPLRVVLALLLRLWQIIGYFHLSLLTLATLFAMWLPPQSDQGNERPRIALQVQFAFLAIILAYLSAMAIVGGAVLARYMLPVLPLVIIICVSTLWRRVRQWRGVIAIVVLAFVAGWFLNPPYGFSPEDNLAYRDYIRLHQHAEQFLEARYPMAHVLTAWPATDELTRPYLGYITRPMRIVRIDDFTVEQLISAADIRPSFDVALVFSTKDEPPHPVLENWRLWREWKERFFGYHRDVPPAAAAQILGGRLVYTETSNRQWIAVIEVEQVVEARDVRQQRLRGKSPN